MKRKQKNLYKTPTKTLVCHSPGKGRGLYASKTIRRGEVIECSPALLVPDAEKELLEKSFLKYYMFQTDDGKHYVVGAGYVAIANHSEEPNAEFDVTSETVTIRAIATIAKGREITVDYGWDESDWEAVGAPRSIRT